MKIVLCGTLTGIGALFVARTVAPSDASRQFGLWFGIVLLMAAILIAVDFFDGESE